MSSLNKYKEFIDGLTRRAKSVVAGRFDRGFWHESPPPDQVKYNKLINSLSVNQRSLISEILSQERIGAIHDVIAFMEDNGYKIRHGNIELPDKPFDTEAHFDFIARVEGEPWPDL